MLCGARLFRPRQAVATHRIHRSAYRHRRRTLIADKSHIGASRLSDPIPITLTVTATVLGASHDHAYGPDSDLCAPGVSGDISFGLRGRQDRERRAGSANRCANQASGSTNRAANQAAGSANSYAAP
jgi:hypothetical protein